MNDYAFHSAGSSSRSHSSGQFGHPEAARTDRTKFEEAGPHQPQQIAQSAARDMKLPMISRPNPITWR